MYDDILVPTDGSSGTQDVLDHAIAIATDNDATIHVLYVVDRRIYTAAAAKDKASIRQSFEEEGDRALEHVRLQIAEAGRSVTTERREGVPNKQIVRYADELSADLIVMGTHGTTGSERVAKLGSTTERVVKNAHEPVLVVDIG